jgi:hypothetical protein
MESERTCGWESKWEAPMPSRRVRAAGSPSSLAATAALLGTTLAAASAHAQPEPVRLAWIRGKGADACSSPQQIADQVAARLGTSPFAANAARSIDAYVTRSESGWRAEIYVRGRDGALAGSRELTSEAPDCAPIESASVLAIALAIDPDAGLRPPPAPAPAPPPAAARTPLPAPLPARVPPSPPPAPLHRSPAAGLGSSSVALRAGAGVGLLPRPAAGLSLAAHVAIARSAQLTGEVLWMPEVRAADARFAFGLTALALGACVDVVRREQADLAACGSLWGGALHAVVYSLKPTEPGDRAWAGAAASPRLRIRVASGLYIEAGMHVLVPIIRQPFTVTGWKDPVFQQAPVTLLPFAGLGATFP